MNKNLIHLAERRSQLVKLAAAQRTVLTHNLKPWRTRLALVDRGMAAFRYMGRHPVLAAGIALVVAAIFRPKRGGKWLQRGWLVWQIGRKLRSR